MHRAPRRAALRPLLLAWMAASGACGTQVADTPIVPGTRYLPAVDETRQPLRFSEVTDALFASPDNLVVLDRVASTLTLIRHGTRAGSLRLPDSTTGALLLSPVRGDSVAVWDAFSGTVSYVDGSLAAIGRVKDDLPVLHSVMGVFGEGVPVLAPVYPVGASAASTYAPDSTPLAVWTDSLGRRCGTVLGFRRPTLAHVVPVAADSPRMITAGDTRMRRADVPERVTCASVDGCLS